MSATTVITAADPVSLDGGRPTMPAATHGTALRVSMVTRDYFRVLGIPVLRGRVIRQRTNAPSRPRRSSTRRRQNDGLARAIAWSNASASDSFGTAAASWLTIVGVDGGIRNDPLFHRLGAHPGVSGRALPPGSPSRGHEPHGVPAHRFVNPGKPPGERPL